MKKCFLLFAFSALLLTACNSGKDNPDKKKDGAETAASLAAQWCELNGKVYRATEGPEKEKAAQALKEFERLTEEKYKDNDAFMKELEREVEKCEAASEGRK